MTQYRGRGTRTNCVGVDTVSTRNVFAFAFRVAFLKANTRLWDDIRGERRPLTFVQEAFMGFEYKPTSHSSWINVGLSLWLSNMDKRRLPARLFMSDRTLVRIEIPRGDKQGATLKGSRRLTVMMFTENQRETS